MSGMLSDRAGFDTRPARFDPPVQRATVRVTNVYCTDWPASSSPPGRALTAHLRLGRLASYYDRAADQLPKVLGRRDIDLGALGFVRWVQSDDVRLVAARIWLLRVPSGQLVVGLSLDVAAAPLQVIDLLEDCYYLDVTVGGEAFELFAARVAAGFDLGDATGRGFAPERHQIVFSADLGSDEQAEDAIQRLIYRADLPYRAEFSAISYPAELNRRPGALVAVGPYVSVVGGQQDYIENGAFISAVQAVASAARLREIRELAYADVRRFRALQVGQPALAARRHNLERIADQLGNIELELSFSVESAADLGLLVPSLRAAGYQDALFNSMGLRDKADTVGRMLERLRNAITAELTTIESVERRADQERRMRWTAAVGFLSTVALPITLVLTFFGINATEVDGDTSMFSARYLPMYAGVAALVLLGLGLSVVLYVQQRLRAREHARRAARAIATVDGLPVIRQREPRPTAEPGSNQARVAPQVLAD